MHDSIEYNESTDSLVLKSTASTTDVYYKFDLYVYAGIPV
jgi:uncharacterized protein YqkB